MTSGYAGLWFAVPPRNANFLVSAGAFNKSHSSRQMISFFST